MKRARIALSTPYFFFAASASFITFFTIFCSSIKKARTTLSLTQFAHRDPPYALRTVLLGFEIWLYSCGRRAGTFHNYCQSLS